MEPLRSQQSEGIILDLKSKIADAAELVIRTNGLAKATTKEIARTAGCSEGSLYNHFKSKDDLYLHILRGQLQNFMQTLISLRDLIGKDTVRSNLEKVARAGLSDYYQSMPLISSIFSEPGLLAQHREGFTTRNEGPHRANEAVESYLLEEQRLGRVSEHVKPRSAADMLLGSCFQYAFQLNFLGRPLSDEEQNEFVYSVLDTLFLGMGNK
ncbi:TetR/AcrR family transcriptional regulator [Paenibacillus sp. GM2FR]|uniref:TetR/AcrR family transcriptional regulator n=1 Tax=Paenibacillus sp. GM2FR TaxID=2059268 RepID=UPI001FAE9373|nr:TetR/AcrR family transcriptional regulator [Paenibacillus sp. GM2FR]